jgi:hypothetical protein
MRSLVAICALCAVTAALAGAATANLTVGINDDGGKWGTNPGWFYPTMQAEGVKLNTITLRWDDAAPTVVPDQSAIAKAVADAKTSGVQIELDLYPLHSQVFTGGVRCRVSKDPESCGDAGKLKQFGRWTATVSRAFPAVHQFVVMNECNQPLFVNPQWNSAGQNQSAQICGRALAAARDALKSVRASNFVWGVGLSPRGNDNAKAVSNSSTSPVQFLHALGAWFKAYAQKTHRKTPLMDGLDFHPYPIPQSLPFARGYAAVNNASVVNLPRIYQAFFTGFAGTPQRTIGEQKGGGLPVSLNEVGIQTDSTAQTGYSGSEVSANGAGGMVAGFASEDYQASWYSRMLALVACDANVRAVNIFHLVDEPVLAGWQSGLYFATPGTPTPKRSAQVVRDWIASTGGRCQGTTRSWTPRGLTSAKR